MLLRVDNFFYNTPDVENLARFHSQSLGIPIRRGQMETPGLMWMELNVGGMELSFRRAGGTPLAHPELMENFLEVAPGKGVTVSFEVSNTDKVRNELTSRGVLFRGGVISCTNGQELISIFEDPFGRPVQLYEAKFDSTELASDAGRGGAASLIAGPSLMGSVGGAANPVAFSNLRDVRDLALSASFYADDLSKAKDFYAGILELPLASEEEDRLVFRLEGTTLEFRKSGASSFVGGITPTLSPQQGGVLAIEIRDLDVTRNRLTSLGHAVETETFSFNHHLVGGRRNSIRDMDGNPIEFWER